MKISIICIIYLLLISYNFSYSQLQTRKKGQKSSGENIQFKFHDNAEGTSMMPITGDVLPLIQYIGDSLKMEIVRL